MLRLEGISKEYNLTPVLQDVSLELVPGRRHLLTGPNGSGKTTLLSIMAGLVKPTRGRVLWNGSLCSPAVRKKIGVMLQAPMLYADLTGVENLRLFGAIYGVPELAGRVRQMIGQVGLEDVAEMPVRQYSKGMRQRLSLARALIHQPGLLLLDEPFDGMDDASVRGAEKLLTSVIQSGGTVFLVAHQLLSPKPGDIHYTIEQGMVDVE